MLPRAKSIADNREHDVKCGEELNGREIGRMTSLS